MSTYGSLISFRTLSYRAKCYLYDVSTSTLLCTVLGNGPLSANCPSVTYLPVAEALQTTLLPKYATMLTDNDFGILHG